MRNVKNLQYKKLIYILMSGFVLTTTGCGKTTDVTTEEVEYTDSYEDGLEVEERNTDYIEENVEEEVEVEERNNDYIEETYTDEDVIQYFQDVKTSISESDTTISAKEKIIKSFITITDFLFYNGEIYGITYDQLKDQTKIQLQQDYLEIDQMIEGKFPNYKEELNSKYNSAKEWLNEKYNYLLEQSKNGLSDETLNNIDEYKNDLRETTESFKDASSSIYEDEKVKVKTWYEGLKNKHE